MQKIYLTISLTATVILIALFFYTGSSHPLKVIKEDSTFNRVAQFWDRKDLGVQCRLCPNNCYLTEGAKGKCKVRMNKDNTLYTQVYAQPVTVHVDPIEKKPVFHMLPGSPILSLSTVGCPLKCSFCQNWSISQEYPEEVSERDIVPPEKIVQEALDNNIPSIAYTYGEPVIFYEYMKDIAVLAKKHGLHNVMVTSGFINPEPLREIAPYFDVIKVDLKGINESFYSDEVDGYLENVLQTLRILKEMNVLVEVVNLVVPNRNDKPADLEKLSRWVYQNLGPDTPLFFSRFHPDYKLSNLPPTPVETLEQARNIAKKVGLNFVYLGNVPGVGENTYCPHDGTLLIEREGFLVKKNILKNGRCPVCGRKIPGIWK